MIDKYTDTDIEKEELEGDEITEPFSPNKIDVDIATINLGSLIGQLKYGEIDLEPDFQRASDVWNNTKKSRLIESILLGLPLPSFYFSEDAQTQKLLVLDGLQRLCAIRDFVLEEEKPLILKNLQFLKDFEGKQYEDLERPEIRRIDTLKITVNILRKSTPSDVKYIIFQRINTEGVTLTAQEMRHALNQGIAANFIKELSELDSFKKATDNISFKRMQDRDLVNRFIAFYLGYKDYNGVLNNFLNHWMSLLNKMTAQERDNIKISFESSMKCCYKIFGTESFRKPNVEGSKRNPISKSLFDCISVNIAWLPLKEMALLEQHSQDFKEELYQLLKTNDSFITATSKSTGQKSSVMERFNTIKNLIKKTIGNDK